MKNIPAIVEDIIGDGEYRLREELLDPDWVEEKTGLNYEGV